MKQVTETREASWQITTVMAKWQESEQTSENTQKKWARNKL